MQDELTAEMHYELMQDEVSGEELFVCAIYGAVKRGVMAGVVLKWCLMLWRRRIR